MSKRIYIFDTTLRDGEQTPGVNLNLQEKLEIARQLEKLGVDVIEAGFAIASPGDFEAVKLVSQEIKNCTIASLARALEKDIDRAWEAVKHAASPRIHLFLATSDIHMQHKLKMSEAEVLERAIAMVKHAKKYTSDIQFSAEDAGRTRPEFLRRVMQGVIDAGATTINIPDTVGYRMPSEFSEIVKGVIDNVTGIEKINVSVHCHNDLGLAVANTLSALSVGATQLECTINGLGERAGNASLEEVVMSIATRPNFFPVTHRIDTTQISRTSKLVQSLTGVQVQPNKAVVGANAFAHESGIHQHGMLNDKSTYEIMTPESVGLTQSKMVLGKLSGKHAFEEKLKELGVNIEDSAIAPAFEKFKQLADKKKDILDEDIYALVEERVSQIPETYQLLRFQINSGNDLISSAVIELQHKDQKVIEAAIGDGPVDSSFKAIERAIGIKLTLKDYKLRAITGGEDAQGEVTVHVVREGSDKIFLGRAISTDVLEASVRAYLNAINRLVLE